MREDPYDVAGWDRPVVKKAFNTLVNAQTRQAAIKSIANAIGGEGAVIEEQANRAAGGQIADVRSSGVDAILQVDPLRVLSDAQLAGLMRSQHRELDALGAEDF